MNRRTRPCRFPALAAAGALARRALTVRVLLFGASLLFVGPAALQAQETCLPRMEQDPALDNLQHEPGYRSAPLAELGPVLQVGNGPLPMVLIAGAGFGPEVFEGFMQAHAGEYSMHAVALPGFGGTAAPPMPPAGTSYAEQTWTTAARDGVARLIEERKLRRPVVVGHWVNATQVALGLALERPDLVRAVVLISGVPRSVSINGVQGLTPDMRKMMVDVQMAPGWFKTVTRETWDDNNFMPRDYARHPLRALQLWKDAARAPLAVNVRYLCEYWARDITTELGRLEVPVLVVQPRFDDLYSRGPQHGGGYMQMFLHGSWEGVAERSDFIRMQVIDDARVFIMDDQPEELSRTIREFLSGPVARGVAGPRKRSDASPTEGAAAAADETLPDFWGGKVEKEGARRLVGDATVSLQLPDGWSLEGVAGEPPVVARMRDGNEASEITIQVVPTPGMSLESLIPLIEARLAGQPGGFAVDVNEPATLDSHPAVLLEGVHQREGEKGRLGLIITKLDENFLMTVTFRASEADHADLQPDFDFLVRSIELPSKGR